MVGIEYPVDADENGAFGDKEGRSNLLRPSDSEESDVDIEEIEELVESLAEEEK